MRILLTIIILYFGVCFNTYSLESDSTLSKIKETVPVNPSDEPHEVYKPFLRIYLGGFHASSVASLTINSDNLGRGTTINPEEVLGLEEKRILPRVEAIVNFGKRHEIGLSYWTIRRQRTRTLDRDIQFADTVFYANTSVNSKFYFSSFSATYRYALLEKEHWNAGVSLGSKVYYANTSITANINENQYSQKISFYEPVPLVGIHGSINTGKHFLVRGTMEYFKINTSEYAFRTLDSRIGVEFYPVKQIGIGADYHYFDTILEKVPSGKLNGEIDYKFDAVSLYLAIRI